MPTTSTLLTLYLYFLQIFYIHKKKSYFKGLHSNLDLSASELKHADLNKIVCFQNLPEATH
jgi:hypothetical protein